ncbi:hypothetical protein IEQ34_005947 [Dendrobium chrysotoxum]|uniref:Uncharacterized protein n=1 Tax=Dendrobium chrysotoxum TaxID=161865 RepID=A0AAV7HDM1_DENCH|nr:hypothetical protein IEQ34_005947 [Dendrobium chrysotoxum]
MGRDPIIEKVRKLPVVGGTDVFRLALNQRRWAAGQRSGCGRWSAASWRSGGVRWTYSGSATIGGDGGRSGKDLATVDRWAVIKVDIFHTFSTDQVHLNPTANSNWVLILISYYDRVDFPAYNLSHKSMALKRNFPDENDGREESSMQADGSKRCCWDQCDQGYMRDKIMKKLEPRDLNWIISFLFKKCKQLEIGSNYYEFQYNTRLLKPTILHIQLRLTTGKLSVTVGIFGGFIASNCAKEFPTDCPSLPYRRIIRRNCAGKFLFSDAISAGNYRRVYLRIFRRLT